jgi:hypothetical protein
MVCDHHDELYGSRNYCTVVAAVEYVEGVITLQRERRDITFDRSDIQRTLDTAEPMVLIPPVPPKPEKAPHEVLTWKKADPGDPGDSSPIFLDRNGVRMFTIRDLPHEKRVTLQMGDRPNTASFRSYAEAIMFANKWFPPETAVTASEVSDLAQKKPYEREVPKQTIQSCLPEKTNELRWVMADVVADYLDKLPKQTRDKISLTTESLLQAFKSVLNKSVLHYYESDIKLSWEREMDPDSTNNQLEKYTWQLREEEP